MKWLLVGLVLLVYALGQLTILSNRLTTLTQELAIRDAEESARRAATAKIDLPPTS